MKLFLDNKNSCVTTITVKGKEIKLLLIESSILIDSSQIAKIFDKKEKTSSYCIQDVNPSRLQRFHNEAIYQYIQLQREYY